MCIICSNDALLVSCLRCNELHHYFLVWPKANSSVAAENSPGSASQDGKSRAPTSESPSEAAVGCCISPCEQYLAVITSEKQLVIWSSQEVPNASNCCSSFQFYSSWTLVKRPVDLVFDSESIHVLVADKTGDVLRFSLRPEDGLNSSTTPPIQAGKSEATDDEENAGSPAPVLLGHLSMLLTLTMSPCGRFMATGDRDEKVRVSHYPRAHNISSFCLGHSEFVAQLRTLPSRPHALLSASGDGSLRIWKFETGEELSMTDTQPQSDLYRLTPEETSTQTVVEDATNSSRKSKSISAESSADSSLPSESTSSSPKLGEDSQGSSQQPGRDRVVPRQCAITCIAVTSAKTSCSNGSQHCNNGASAEDLEQSSNLSTSDLIAVCFDRSRSLSLFGLTADNCLRHLYTTQLPVPASTLTWLDGDTLVVLCPNKETGEENDEQEPSPVLVWLWSGEKLSLVQEHSLSKFAAQNALRFKEYLPDATVLFKQRYDNVAEYQKKKQNRLQKQEQLTCKRIKLSSEETECR